jgi:hypothetical protein
VSNESKFRPKRPFRQSSYGKNSGPEVLTKPEYFKHVALKGDLKQMDNEPQEAQLDAFFSGLHSGLESLREVRSAFDEEIAFDFDPLQFFSINENTVSNMLAYFVNPKAKHGQKDAFLRIFLQMVKCDAAIELLNYGKEVVVNTQARTGGGRPIDVVITFGANEFIIGIENKVWGAMDQEKQLEDYIEHIKKESINKFLMLYLSPYGEAPSPFSISNYEVDKYESDKKFRIIPFDQSEGVAVIPILKAFADESKADNVRTFLKLMIKYLSNYFLGVKTMDEDKFITKYLTNNPERMKLVLEMLSSADTIRQAILQIQINQIASEIEKSSLNMQIVFAKSIGELKRKYAHFCRIVLKGWTQTEIFYEFDTGGMRNCYYGITNKGNNSAEFLKRIKASLNFNYLNPTNCNGPFKYPNWDGSQPWIDMVTNTESGLSKFAEVFERSMNDLIDCAQRTAAGLHMTL